jgi:uncharacterized membrane protein
LVSYLILTGSAVVLTIAFIVRFLALSNRQISLPVSPLAPATNTVEVFILNIIKF